MMLRALSTACLAMLLPLGAVSAQPADPAPADQPSALGSLAGAWDLRVDGTTIFRFEIAATDGDEWTGQWLRPARFNSDGNSFYNIRGGVQTSPSMTGITFDGAAELAFDDPRPGAVPDIFRFRLTGEDSAEMIYVGTGLAPYALVRAHAADTMGSWDATRLYSRFVDAAPEALAHEAEMDRSPDRVPDRAAGLVLPAINFDLAGLDRGISRPAPEVLPPAGQSAAAEPVPPVPTVDPAETAPPEVEPSELPRFGFDFLEGL